MSPLYTQFNKAARDLATNQNKVIDFCRNIVDHKDFVAFARQDIREAARVLEIAFATMKGEEAWKSAMAFIQTEGALEMADNIRPEYMIEPLAAAMKKMDAQGKADFQDFMWMTKASKALIKNDPHAKTMLMLEIMMP